MGLPLHVGEEEAPAPAVVPAPPAATLDQIDDLLEAARYADIDDMMRLASIGVSLNCKDSQGKTALHMAAANGHLDIVQYLIQSGVDINATNVELNTPLHWACLNGHIEVIKALILGGASVSMLNSHERTPVDEALSRSSAEVMDAINTSVGQVELNGLQVA